MPMRALFDAETAGATHWQSLLREAIRDSRTLLAYLELDEADVAALDPRPDEFPLLVPRGYAARMRKRDPTDPLLRQVLPSRRELDATAGYTTDPLGELSVSRRGIVRKYPGRALLITTGACPVHCRYCFRRHFPYDAQLASRDDWSGTIAELRTQADITEVILSGGDPLSLSNRRLSALAAALEAIEHVTTLRIHSRFPIVLPERIEDGLLKLLESTRLAVVLVTHANHAQEIDDHVAAALGALRSVNVTLLNQSVLLRGVNDDATTLCELSRRLFAVGALPYYLHELDPVAGAAHFDLPRARAVELIAQLRGTLPGYLVPRLVREIPGELGKTVIA